jgi:hypothetical protein
VKIIKAPLVPLDTSLSVRVALDAFNSLSECGNHLVESGWSAEEVFWSRYFWISTYSHFTHSTAGPEPGLEQFIHKLLDQPSPYCEPDWACVERVVDLSRCETARWLESSPSRHEDRLDSGSTRTR